MHARPEHRAGRCLFNPLRIKNQLARATLGHIPSHDAGSVDGTAWIACRDFVRARCQGDACQPGPAIHEGCSPQQDAVAVERDGAAGMEAGEAQLVAPVVATPCSDFTIRQKAHLQFSGGRSCARCQGRIARVDGAQGPCPGGWHIERGGAACEGRGPRVRSKVQHGRAVDHAGRSYQQVAIVEADRASRRAASGIDGSGQADVVQPQEGARDCQFRARGLHLCGRGQGLQSDVYLDLCHVGAHRTGLFRATCIAGRDLRVAHGLQRRGCQAGQAGCDVGHTHHLTIGIEGDLALCRLRGQAGRQLDRLALQDAAGRG
ncbi:hypothetical protein BW39_00540 [Delftia sp. RIT313]|nr:hypothetical protein BW39_00540 [Delftia sp. RIT313]